MINQIELQEFVTLLENLTVINNNLRSSAERQYEMMKITPESFLPLKLLSVVVESSVSNNIRRLSAVLLRRIMIDDENSIYNQLDQERQQILKSGLMSALDYETDPYLKARICDIIGELATFIVHAGEWPEILPYTHISIQSPDALQREMGLALLGMLAEEAARVISVSNTSFEIVNIYSTCLQDTSNEGRVLIAAIRSLASLLSYLPSQQEIDIFQSVAPQVMQSLISLIQIDTQQQQQQNSYNSNSSSINSQQQQQQTENVYSHVLVMSYVESLIEIAESCPTFYENSLFEIVSILCDIIDPNRTTNLVSSIRHIVLELLITLSTNLTKQLRKLKDPQTKEKGYFVSRLFPICLNLMINIPEEIDWEQSQLPEESVESVNDSDVAETALDRMCKSLGLTATWGVVSSQFSQLLQNTASWQSIHTGLRYLGNYMEVSKSISSKKQLKEHVIDMGTRIMGFVSHPHPRIRAAAFYALGQFFSMHHGTITASQTQQVLPQILQSLNVTINPSPRVRRYVLICLINIIDSSPAVSIMNKHTGEILEAVTSALEVGPLMIQELGVSAIISLAETIGTGTSGGNALREHYDSLMPILKNLLAYAHTHGLESLLGQGMECCAMVGEASGKNKFYSDALEMMNSLVSMQSELEDGSEARKYLMKAWVRIARCLEADFLPFLDLVMGQLLVAITQETTADNIDPDELETRSDIQMLELETGWVAIRTAAVEEQASACQLVMLIADRLQEHFSPYVEATVRALVPLLESPHDDVRSYSIVAMPELIRSIAKATSPDRNGLMVLTDYVIGQLIKAIETESTIELIMTGLQALRYVFVYSCTNWELLRPFTITSPPKCTPENSITFLSLDQMRSITQCATIILRDSLQRRAVLRAEAQVTGHVDDDDIADEAIFQHESMELHFNIAELLGIILRTHGILFMEVFQEIWHDAVCTMAHLHCLKEDRQFAYFVISDVIEFGLTDEMAVGYYKSVIPLLLEGCVAPEPNIRQTCAYSIGIGAETHPQIFRPYALDSLNTLAACIAMGESDDESRGTSTDNAVSAVGIILERMESLPPNNEGDRLTDPFPYIWGQWIGYLPIRDDVEEGGKVLYQLCRLFNNKNQNLFIDRERVKAGVAVLLEVLGTNLVGEELTREIVQTLQLLRVYGGFLGVNGLEELVHEMSPEHQQKFQHFMSLDMSSPNFSSSPQAPAPIHDVLMR